MKTAQRYEFRYTVDGIPQTRRDAIYRFKLAARGYGIFLRANEAAFGFRARNHRIRHADLWDSIYPLMFLTRNGGPLYSYEVPEARIAFGYPIVGRVRDFFVQRAANFGITLHVEADEYQGELPALETEGSILSFGGGKDSRMLLGVFRETGRNPRIMHAGKTRIADLPECLLSLPVTAPLANRVMPCLMALPRCLYYGGGFGEIQKEMPWQQYYDWAACEPLQDFSALLRSCGVEMSLASPASVLPYNIIQNILHRRYPQLFANQTSVGMKKRSNSALEKRLHVALLKLYHSISIAPECTPETFREAADRFVRQQTERPAHFGKRNYREIINREMRSIIFRKRTHQLLAHVASNVPETWNADWIDYIHLGAYPQLDSAILEIYREHAEVFNDTQRSTLPFRY